jgi:tetratricopeptide (TPR) repeat protein
MIVKDEEYFLDDALRSAAGVVDEICIVDTGSNDRTIEIARAHGARVVEFAWRDDFALARNAALALATRRWIFVLDADERLAAGSRAALSAIGRSHPNGRGKWLMCRNLTDNFKGSGAMSNALVRIFPNDPRIRYRNAIHEFITLDGGDAGLSSDTTAIEIEHHGYLGAVMLARRKGERNLRLARAAALREPYDGFHQYNLGMASLLGGDADAAIAALERMRELTHLTPRGYRVHGLASLADLYAEHRGDSDTARELLFEVLRLVPNYSNAHFSLGKLLARSGDLFEARNAFGRAIAAAAYDHEQFVVDNEIGIWKAHSEIGATLMLEGRFAEALKWFELAAAVRPAVQLLVLNRAKCHEALGDLSSARTLLATAFAAYRDEVSATEWINFLLRAGQPGEAFEAIEHALPLVGEEFRTLILGTAAAAHLRAGRPGRAKLALDRAVAVDNRATATATIVALAAHFALPELARLLPVTPGLRANGLRIAYGAYSDDCSESLK